MLIADWIKTSKDLGDVCPAFNKNFSCGPDISKATLKISARGVYVATLNGNRVGDFVMAPGWTMYDSRIQLQEYDVTDSIGENNELIITVANGWYLGRISRILADDYVKFPDREMAVIAQLDLQYTDGRSQTVCTDNTWLAGESCIRFCDIYDGEVFDSNHITDFCLATQVVANNDKSVLIPQQGEYVVEQERIKPIAIIKTPNGETVLDFGQNLTGYMEFSVSAKKGDICDFSFAEILDKEGNFYNKNYRTAKCMYNYTCKDGVQTHKPTHTFYGFRYVRINQFPEHSINLENFTAIVLHSKLSRTGWLSSSDELLNKLFENVIWGQKSNYLDIPTDCPQRDERLGWTGDAQIFMRTACYNFNVKTFFNKWLDDLQIAQKYHKDGALCSFVPSMSYTNHGGAAWGDAATVCPWELYRMYGDKELLRHHFPMMKKWVDSITNNTTKPNLWFGGSHYGDWLELTGEYGATKGMTRDDVIASGFYAYSTSLVIKAGEVLGEDVTEYKTLYKNIQNAFKNEFKDDFKTQTECIVALHFGLCYDENTVISKLIDMIEAAGRIMQTGFVGTPYLLHVLTKYGHSELAYDLLLRKEYPSWLYPVTMGATTMWEHWDGIRPDGKLWPDTMNSYNHYAYGAVCDWVYGTVCGINPTEEKPGFAEVLITPIATDKLQCLSAKLETAYGTIYSGWYHKDGRVVYEIETPVSGKAVIEGREYILSPGKYVI